MLTFLPWILLYEGMCYAIFRSTPGKALLRIRVAGLQGASVSASDYLKRLVGLFWSGLGMGLPLIQLVMMGIQYSSVSKGQPTGYDRGKFFVKAQQLSTTRFIVATVLVAVVVTFGAGVSRAINDLVRKKQSQAVLSVPNRDGQILSRRSET